ncbi:MAG: hypothetical protein WB983_16340 [Terriglobales bacterium]
MKWAGIAVTACYLALLFGVFWRFRSRLFQLRLGLILPVVFGNFVGTCVSDIFESVLARRVCFVAASVIYLYGFPVLARGLSQDSQKGLFKDGAADDYIQPLKLS